MKAELNIANILKDKLEGISLYSSVFGDCVYRDNYDDCIEVVTDNCYYFNEKGHYITNGVKSENGECLLFPSNKMRDWSKFAWKKGDVLVNKDGDVYIIFERFADDTYCSFVGKYYLWKENNHTEPFYKNERLLTSDFQKAGKDAVKTYISTIEERLSGKLNLETLEIEQPKPEFKDGDIVCISGIGYLAYGIVKSINNSSKKLEYYVLNDMSTLKFEDWLSFEDKQIQPITETQQIILFEALAKEGKRWNPDTKKIEGLPKKCEFKPMDWCLMRDKKETWKLCQFSFFDDGDYEAHYNAVGGNWFDECIPYNEETKHLLNTTDKWKGGEQ